MTSTLLDHAAERQTSRNGGYPTVYIIRHGQSQYNHFDAVYQEQQVLKSPSVLVQKDSSSGKPTVIFNPSIIKGDDVDDSRPDFLCADAELTNTGEMQATRLREQLAQYQAEHPDFHMDVIIVSPLTRAIQTALIALADYHQQYTDDINIDTNNNNNDKECKTNNSSNDMLNNDDTHDGVGDYMQDVPLILQPLCAEHCYALCDTGRPLSSILRSFPSFIFDTSLIQQPDAWWYGANKENANIQPLIRRAHPTHTEDKDIKMIIQHPSKSQEQQQQLQSFHNNDNRYTLYMNNNNNKRELVITATPQQSPGHNRSTSPQNSSINTLSNQATNDAAGANNVDILPLTVQLLPHLVSMEPWLVFENRITNLIAYLLAFPPRTVITIVAHCQVFATLGQGSLRNAEMKRLVWDLVPQEMIRQAINQQSYHNIIGRE